jgi:hypothetical protein
LSLTASPRRSAQISRRAAWVLVVASAWTLYIWVTRIYTLVKQDESRAFKVVHFVLAAISIALGVAVGSIGIRALRREPR